MEIRQQPPDRYLPWIGNGRTQDVRVEALAPKSNGDWDKDVCELQVIVSGTLNTVFIQNGKAHTKTCLIRECKHILPRLKCWAFVYPLHTGCSYLTGRSN